MNKEYIVLDALNAMHSAIECGERCSPRLHGAYDEAVRLTKAVLATSDSEEAAAALSGVARDLDAIAAVRSNWPDWMTPDQAKAWIAACDAVEAALAATEAPDSPCALNSWCYEPNGHRGGCHADAAGRAAVAVPLDVLRKAVDALETEVRWQLRGSAPGLDPMAGVKRRDLDERFATLRAVLAATEAPAAVAVPLDDIW